MGFLGMLGPLLGGASAAGGLLSSLFGGDNGQGKANEAQAALAAQQGAIAKKRFDETALLRNQGDNQLLNFLYSGNLPHALRDSNAAAPTYGLEDFLSSGVLPAAVAPTNAPAGARDVLEQQFQGARDRLIEQAPTQGGALAEDLLGLESARALGVTGLESDRVKQEQALREKLFGVGLDLGQKETDAKRAMREKLFAEALGVGSNAVGNALTGTGNAASQYGNIASTALARTTTERSALTDQLGTLAGFFLYGGGGAKKDYTQYDAPIGPGLFG